MKTYVVALADYKAEMLRQYVVVAKNRRKACEAAKQQDRLFYDWALKNPDSIVTRIR